MEKLSDANKKLMENEILLFANKKFHKDANKEYYLKYYEKNKKFVDFLSDFYDLENKKILDYGCGTGFIADLFSKKSNFVSGCDFSKNQLKKAREFTSSQIHYFQDDFFDSKLQKSNYDFIFCRGLSVLVKMDLDDDAVSYVNSIIDSLNDDGIAYFVFMGNLSGKKDNDEFGFRNPTMKQLVTFFNKVGFVSMINFCGYQAIVLTRNKNLAQYYNKKMEKSVIKLLNNLTVKEIGEYIACQLWLLANSTRRNIKKFKRVDKFIDYEFLEKLEIGVCTKNNENIDCSDYNGNVFFIDGDHDALFIQSNENIFFRYKPIRHKLWKLKRRFFK